MFILGPGLMGFISFREAIFLFWGLEPPEPMPGYIPAPTPLSYLQYVLMKVAQYID